MKSRFILQSGWLLLLAVFTGTASAAVVAQLDGPTEYGPGTPMVVLPSATVGDEGYVELEFKADSLDNSCIWYLADAFGGTGAGGEYRLYLWDGAINAKLWNTGGYAASAEIPFSDTTSWHSLSMAWKEGEETLVTLDGATTNVTNTHVLADFTSGEGQHVLGGYPSGGSGSALFNGSVRDMKLCDTYEESTSVVAQHAGPTSFSTNPMQPLSEATIGDEGTVELEFKADSTANSCIWYLADAYGGTSTGGEYRLYFWEGSLVGTLWNSGSYAANINIPFEDTTEWHSLSMTWKEGEETQLTLDGVTTAVTNDSSLMDFTSGEGQHVLGGYPSGGAGSNLFDGATRKGDPSGDGFVGGDDLDIVRANWGQGTPPSPTAVPEPTTLVLLLGGWFGLLAARLR